MIIYHLKTCGKEFGTHKVIFTCYCALRDYLDMLSKQVPAAQKRELRRWNTMNEEEKENYFAERVVISRIDTEKVKEWRKMFRGTLYASEKAV